MSTFDPMKSRPPRRETEGSQALAAWLVERKMYAHELAKKLGLTKGAIRNWLLGVCPPGRERRLHLHAMTGIEPMAWERDPKTTPKSSLKTANIPARHRSTWCVCR